MTVDELIGAFAAEFGIGPVRPDEAGAYHLDFDDMTVAFRETGDGTRLLVFGEVGELPDGGAEVFCRVMLKAMFLEGTVSGATFALAPETEQVFLQQQKPLAELDSDRFKATVESFVNELEKWRQTLVDFRPVADEIGKAKARTEQEAGEMASGGFIRV